MKIGYLLEQDVDVREPPFDGPATHVREVVQTLQQQGHTVRLLLRLEHQLWCSDDLQEFSPVTVPLLDHVPLRYVERGVRRIQYELQLPYAAFFESQRFARACQKLFAGYDLLYERMSWFDYGGALAARRMDLPLILECNGDHLTDLEAKGMAPQGWQRQISVLLMKWAVESAAHVVVSGDGWRNLFLQRWEVDPDRVTTVENGTNLLGLLGRDQLYSFGDSNDLDDPVTIVYLGGFQPWQGVNILLRAVANAQKEVASLRLVLVGAGDGLRQAHELVEKLQLQKSVTFAGHLPQEMYAPLLAKAQIGVAPYCNWPEFSGLKVFDYKAAGLATIASGVNGLPRTLRQGQTGWIVPPCDEMALSEAIVFLAKNAELRQRLGQQARVESELLHSWEKTGQRLEQIMTHVVCLSRQIHQETSGMLPGTS